VEAIRVLTKQYTNVDIFLKQRKKNPFFIFSARLLCQHFGGCDSPADAAQKKK
jgi:hypothetical protein